MSDLDVTATARQLQTRSPERLWGVSPESIYAALSSKVTEDRLEDALGPHLRAEKLRTNDEREPELVAKMHDWILDESNLTKDDQTTLVGSLILSVDEPLSLIRAVIVASSRTIERVLRSGLTVDDENLPRREFDSLVAGDWEEGVLGPLLGSAGFASIYPDSVVPNSSRVESALGAQREVPIDEATAEAYRYVLPRVSGIEDETSLADMIQQLNGTRPDGVSSLESVAASLSNAAVPSLDTSALKEVIADQREEYEQVFETFRSLLVSKEKIELSRIDVEDPVSTSDIETESRTDEVVQNLLLDVLATVSQNPGFSTFDSRFIIDRIEATPYDLYKLLSSVPEVRCGIDDRGLINFDAVPEQIEGDSLRSEYTAHLVDRCTDTQRRLDAVTKASVSELSPAASDSVVAQDYESLSDGDVAPAYFTYTLLNPAALGEEKMDEYVGDSRGLGRERAQLHRWHEEKPAGMRSYTAMTDRLFSVGLEREIESRIIRIMTPFDDDTFHEYVSQIRQLLRQGFELRLLTRHTKESWEWERLQENLFDELETHREQVTLRTYSRFKQYQRVTPETDFRGLGEFGIHGKVQIVGSPDNGAVLLGSANFMENSYDWNPECGVYTEQKQLVDSAIRFFDIVWEIAAADELDIERLEAVPNHQLIPNFYD